jgi:hypothetical protein
VQAIVAPASVASALITFQVIDRRPPVEHFRYVSRRVCRLQDVTRHVARYQRDRFVTQLDIKDSLEHEEEVIRLVVLMPDEGTLEFVTTMMSCPLNSATVRGAKWSENCPSFSTRFTFCDMSLPLLCNLDLSVDFKENFLRLAGAIQWFPNWVGRHRLPG